jgi:hypothetical protein
MATQISLKIAGVTFEGRQGILKTLYESKAKPDVRLIQEPTNPYDPNAVKVEFKVAEEWRHVGYIEKKVSEEVTKSLQDGSIEKVEFEQIAPVASKQVLWSSIIVTGKA